MSQYASATNSIVRMPLPHLPDDHGPELLGRRRPDPVAPGLAEHVVESAASPCRTGPRRTGRRWTSSVSTVASRTAGRNALSCTTSGHAGKYGSRPRASTCPSDVDERAGLARPGRPRCRARSHSGSLAHATGGPGRRGWARSRASAARRAGPARPGPRPGRPGRPAGRPRRTGGRSTASRRRRRARGRAAPRGRRPAALVAQRDGQPGRAALPDAHQPDRVHTGRRERVPHLGGHVGQRAGGRVPVPARPATARCRPRR